MKKEDKVGLVDMLSSRWVNEFNLPNGYIFKDENGNVINATKIVLEKKNNFLTSSYPSGANAQQVYRSKYDESII